MESGEKSFDSFRNLVIILVVLCYTVIHSMSLRWYVVSGQFNYTKNRVFHAILLPVFIEFSRGIGTYSSAKFELCNYPDKYRKDTKTGFKWLNENATIYDFECINNLLTRLTDSVEITKETQAVFNSKHTFIFVAAFKSFTELGRKDEEFGKFLEWFVNGGNETEINGKSWKEWDSDRSTRDSGVVHGKLDYLVLLMSQYSEEVKKAA